MAGQRQHNSNSEQRSRFLCEFFDEDVVYRTARNGRTELGVVVESSENASSDEEEDSNEAAIGSRWKRIKPGHAKVAWYPKGNTEVVPEKRVKLLDRSLLPGDVVRHMNQSNDQRGYCKESLVFLTLRIIGTNKVLEVVNCSDLIPLTPINCDIVCLYKSWIGYIHDTKFNVTLKCNDGSRLVVSDDDLLDFDDMMSERSASSEFDEDINFIGQHLQGYKRYLRRANWLNQTPEMRSFMESTSRRQAKVRLVVEEVNMASLSIKWLCCISNAAMKSGAAAGAGTSGDVDSPSLLKASGDEGDKENKNGPDETSRLSPTLSQSLTIESPSDIITGEEIKYVKELNYFQKSSLQVGDRGYYVIKPLDETMCYDDWKRKVSNKLGNSGWKSTNGVIANDVLHEDCEEIFADDESDSQFVDMSDDEMSVGGDSCSVTNQSQGSDDGRSRRQKKKGISMPVKKIRDKTLKPSKRIEKMASSVTFSPMDRVAVEVVSTETKVSVVWQDNKVEDNIPSYLLYPVHHLDNHDFFPGDFVVENKEVCNPCEYGVVQCVDHSARTASIHWLNSANNDPPQLQLKEQVSVYDIKDHPDFHYRPGSCVIRIPADESSEVDKPSTRAGQVVNLSPSGQLLCAWADGSQTFCYPQELYVIGEYDSDDLWGDSDYDVDGENEDGRSSTGSWETESELTVNDTPRLETPTNEQKSKSHSNHKSEKENTAATPGDMIDLLRKAITQLEEWFRDNPTMNYRNGLAAMQKIFKVCRQLKSIDEQLGTSLIKLKDLQSLVENAKPPPGASGRMHLIATKLGRLLSSSSSSSQTRRASTQAALDSISYLMMDAEDEQHEEEVPAEGAVGFAPCFSPTSPSTPTSKTAFAPNTNVCLELLNKLKSHLFHVCANIESQSRVRSGKKLVEDHAEDLETGLELKVQLEEVSPPAPEDKAAGEDSDVAMVTESERTGDFQLMESVPDSHKFKLSILVPNSPKQFFLRVKKEMGLLQSSLPEDIVVKSFEDRMDLFSVMIKGPRATPYEGGLFLFDIQLPANYPHVPPVVHYVSYCNDRLNPNLYENGKVCVSLLGTWSGKGSEVWSASNSNLLQLLVSIQGLILVAEPYYNEAGYLRQKGTALGTENSRLYNEMAVVKLVQSMAKMLVSPPDSFRNEIEVHLKATSGAFVSRLEKWIAVSEKWNSSPEATCSGTSLADFERLRPQLYPETILPEFPLLPGSQGFCLSLRKALKTFTDILGSLTV